MQYFLLPLVLVGYVIGFVMTNLALGYACGRASVNGAVERIESLRRKT